MFGQDLYDHSRYLDYITRLRRDRPYCAEITPSYALCGADVLREMVALHGSVKFVFLVRDPVDRLWSGLRQRAQSVLAARPDPEMLTRMALAACANPHDPDVLRSRYDLTLGALDAAGADVCVLLYETLFSTQSMNTLFQHLGIAMPENIPFDRDQHPGVLKSAAPPPQIETMALNVLKETYQAVRDRFGDAVPANWRAPEARQQDGA